jgi:hypothetical protein
MKELRRYMQEKEKEKEQIQNERMARLAHWREDIAIQPTCWDPGMVLTVPYNSTSESCTQNV